MNTALALNIPNPSAAATARERIYEYLLDCPMGSTCDAIERNLGIRHQSASARLRDLVLAGRIHHRGMRKTSAGVPARVYFSGAL